LRTVLFSLREGDCPETAWSWYGWDTRANALRDTVARPVGAAGAKIPELAFVFHHCMFASFT
jgi:hypothetical protein